MCYAKKIVSFDYRGKEVNLGEKFNGKFDCAKFNCSVSGCNEGFVDGEAPKRN